MAAASANIEIRKGIFWWSNREMTQCDNLALRLVSFVVVVVVVVVWKVGWIRVLIPTHDQSTVGHDRNKSDRVQT